MNLILARERPNTFSKAECIHCDERIIAEDCDFYVRLSFGPQEVNLHDGCFQQFMIAIQEFNRLFVEDTAWGLSIH